MAVTLREITIANFGECIGLRVGEAQKNYVAPNLYSLAEAKADGVSNPLGIYADEQMVGFVMYDYNVGERRGYLSRLMIDARFQGHGYARAALEQVMKRLRAMPGIREIQTSFHPENRVAEALYASFGLTRTGELDHGEIVVRLQLAQ